VHGCGPAAHREIAGGHRAHLRKGSRHHGGPGVATGHAAVHQRCPGSGGSWRVPVHCRGHACPGRRRRRLACRGAGGTDHRRAHGRRQDHRHQEHGTGGYAGSRARDRIRTAGTTTQRGNSPFRGQSRVSQGRPCGGGLPQAGSHRDRDRQHAGCPGHAVALPALQSQERPAFGDGAAFRGTHQVRRQCHAGHQDQLHERTCRHRPARGCRCGTRAPRHWFRPAHRLSFHLSRLRLWRFLSAQGLERPDPYGTKRRLPSCRVGGCLCGQCQPEAAFVQEITASLQW